MKTLSAPLKCHGGKRYILKDILALMPPRAKRPNNPSPDDPGWLHYVEPYCGSAKVLLALDPEGISEVVNDLNGEFTNFYDVVKSPTLFPEFQRLAALTPVSQVEFERARDGSFHFPVERALALFIRNRQSRQALEEDFVTPVQNRTRRGMDEHVSAWLSAIQGLPAFHARLQRVRIVNRPALEVIRAEDGLRTLHYLDPPYVAETRTARNAYGKFEMSEDDHRELLTVLQSVQGMVILSGYANPLYDTMLVGWKSQVVNVPNHAAGGKTKRRMTEMLWINPACVRAQK
jgi:DNA adenine methylase